MSCKLSHLLGKSRISGSQSAATRACQPTRLKSYLRSLRTGTPYLLAVFIHAALIHSPLATGATRLDYRYFGTDQTLPSTDSRAFLFDTRGFSWTATDQGLYRLSSAVVR